MSTFLPRKYDVISQLNHSYAKGPFCVTRLKSFHDKCVTGSIFIQIWGKAFINSKHDFINSLEINFSIPTVPSPSFSYSKSKLSNVYWMICLTWSAFVAFYCYHSWNDSFHFLILKWKLANVYRMSDFIWLNCIPLLPQLIFSFILLFQNENWLNYKCVLNVWLDLTEPHSIVTTADFCFILLFQNENWLICTKCPTWSVWSDLATFHCYHIFTTAE